MARKREPELKRAAIIDAAISLFLEKGYEQTSTTDILAKAGGISRGALYHHFSSKQAILQAIPNHLLRADETYHDLFNSRKLNGIEKVRGLFQHGMERLSTHPEDRLYTELLAEPNMLALRIQTLNQQTAPLYEELIRQGNADGSMQVEDPRSVAQMVAILLNIWCTALVPGTAEDFYDRFVLLKKQLETLGMPLIDDETLNLCRLFSAELANLPKPKSGSHNHNERDV